MAHAEPSQPLHRVAKTVVLKVEPLADAHRRREFAKDIQRQFWRPVLPQHTHIKVPVIGRAFRLTMAGGGGPGAWQIVKAVPMNAGRFSPQQFRGSPQAPSL